MNETNYKQKERTEITASITNIFKNMDRNGKEYLLIKTDRNDPKKDNDNIAIFSFRLTERWGELNEGGKYTFICEISERIDKITGEQKTTYILADFLKIGDNGPIY